MFGVFFLMKAPVLVLYVSLALFMFFNIFEEIK